MRREGHRARLDVDLHQVGGSGASTPSGRANSASIATCILCSRDSPIESVGDIGAARFSLPLAAPLGWSCVPEVLAPACNDRCITRWRRSARRRDCPDNAETFGAQGFSSTTPWSTLSTAAARTAFGSRRQIGRGAENLSDRPHRRPRRGADQPESGPRGSARAGCLGERSSARDRRTPHRPAGVRTLTPTSSASPLTVHGSSGWACFASMASLMVRGRAAGAGLPYESVLRDRCPDRRRPDHHRHPRRRTLGPVLGLPNSYGTLGYSTRLRIQLEPVKRDAALRHLRFGTPEQLQAAMDPVVTERSMTAWPATTSTASCSPRGKSSDTRHTDRRAR